ncbi:MAG: hypothetical protein AAFQ80_24010 [Cyanobacteria bacterium J06621_8]
MSNQNKQNNSVIESGLKIPVIDLSLAESGKYLSEPETINDSLLDRTYARAILMEGFSSC